MSDAETAQAATGLNEALPAKLIAHDGETLSNAAYRQLKTDIIRGTRRPGERLRIEKLRRIYNVGPTPLREALQRLSAEAIVVSEGNRGFTVAPIDAAEFIDLNVARIAVEKEALRLSIAKGDNTWEADVAAAAYLMAKEDRALKDLSDGVHESWETANTRFHLAMVAACGSKWLLHTRSQLAALCERYRLVAVSDTRGSRDLEAEHKAIADAVLDRDAEAACEFTVRHYGLTADALLAKNAGE